MFHLFFPQDFNIHGSRLISCGMDHSLKMWRVDAGPIQEAIENSYTYNAAKAKELVLLLCDILISRVEYIVL